MPSISSLDYNQPLSEILKQSTKEAHDEVATSPEAGKLLRGELSKEQYARYLMMLWHVYAAIEQGLERHAAHPVFEPTYNPALLFRAPALSSDISTILQVSEWKTHPIHHRLICSPPQGLTDFVNRIHECADAPDPSPLLAHAYVRYLGDLSGGQTIRHTLAKAYNLDEKSGQGLQFYAFKELTSSKSASQGDMKKIKEWYRAGMNEGVGDDLKRKSDVVDEASLSFRLNARLFAAISQSEPEPSEEVMTKEQLAALVNPLAPEQSGYSVQSVVVLIVAVSIGHFLLTVGGFTGQRGWIKLMALEEWLHSTWRSITTSA
ncbi:hypothetical protein K435DRAFT_836069 [Dendrothele bispora CBS 962.96]|uniref:Heme oxygenase-like protein n=1 Tax=Dendrothele bispora (strain CBS 962.96) TaxID=1314807 RepID=A0A4S8MJP1_DENBC|nr:hypothetical protein K435DRAFT_836069 [Dendrothele bispora CBS 962.96]